ncbi:MAG: OB-fold domain-containing protein [Treponema sp.]|nr:OB-fold domain-containing protein [Treponema sp.]
MNTGTIYTYTIIYAAAEEFADKAPYLCAVVQDASGSRSTSMISGWKPGVPVKIGQTVYAETGEGGEISGYRL